MQISGVTGTVAGLPLKAGAVSLSGADAAVLLGATAGLVKTLAIAGASAVGIALLAAIATAEETRKDESVSIAAFAHVTTDYREFIGICKEEAFRFISEDQELEVPLHLVHSIDNAYGKDVKHGGFDIELVDGSKYRKVKPLTKKLAYITVAGIQTVSFAPWNEAQYRSASLEGVSWRDLWELKRRLTFALERNLDAAIQEVGEEIVAKFFQIERV